MRSRSAGAPGNEEIPLTAAQYAEGHLDWHSVDYDPEINLGRGGRQGKHVAACAQ